MKKAFLTSSALIVFIAATIAYIHQNKNEPTSEWEKYYTQKQNRRKAGKPGTKTMRIREIDKYFKGLHTKFDGTEVNYPANHLMKELEKAIQNRSHLKSANSIDWVSRGPGNVGGRTRSIVVDISDPSHKTWFAGSATGGLWKTSNEGLSWKNLSEGLPYHAISTVVQSQSQPDIFWTYAQNPFQELVGVEIEQRFDRDDLSRIVKIPELFITHTWFRCLGDRLVATVPVGFKSSHENHVGRKQAHQRFKVLRLLALKVKHLVRLVFLDREDNILHVLDRTE